MEWCPDASATYRAHHPAATVIRADITTVDFKAERGRFALVAGGPPCQPFSVGGKRLAADDPRNGIPQFLRAVAELRPNAFLMENVPGLAVSTKRPYFLAVLGRLEQLGYLTTWRVLEAADYGVPQTRRRLFVVGTRGGAAFRSPAPTHGPSAQRPAPRAGLVVDPQHPRGEPNTAIITYARRPSLRPGAYHGHLYNGGGRPIELCRPAPTLLASMGGNKTPWLDTLGVVPEYHAHLLAAARLATEKFQELAASRWRKRQCSRGSRRRCPSPAGGPASTARLATPSRRPWPKRSGAAAAPAAVRMSGPDLVTRGECLRA